VRLLVIEDDARLGGFLQQNLRAEGYAVDLAETGAEGLARAASQGYDVILLDLALRDTPGLELLVRLRQEGITTPVLALGAKVGPSYVVEALDAGADEYVTPPVSTEEIAARVRAMVRRTVPIPPLVLVFENVALNIVTHQAFVDGQPLRLTPKEFSLLQHFLRRLGDTISRSELLEHVWEMHFDPGSNVVDVHVSRLRSKLQAAGARMQIEAVRGAGFVLAARQSSGGERDIVA
jgi:two-component system OmpR family response regulator